METAEEKAPVMRTLLLCLLPLGITWAQTPREAPAAEAPRPATRAVPIVPASDLQVLSRGERFGSYPILAELGHVQGKVRVRVALSAEGNVTAVKAMAGPPMLRYAAEWILRTFTFKPVVVEGKACPVVSEFEFPFLLDGGREDQPELPITGYALKVEALAPEGPARVAADLLEKEMRIRLGKAGLEARNHAEADPLRTLDLTLRVGGSKGEGTILVQDLVWRVSTLADRDLQGNLSGKPARVWFLHRVLAQKGEEALRVGVLASLDSLMDALLPMEREATRAPGLSAEGQGERSRIVDFDFSQIRIRYQPPSPPYPPAARIARNQGVVVVELQVDPTGVPQTAVAVTGPASLQECACQYALGWRFEPVKMNGIPQTVRFRLTMPFKLR